MRSGKFMLFTNHSKKECIDKEFLLLFDWSAFLLKYEFKCFGTVAHFILSGFYNAQ